MNKQQNGRGGRGIEWCDYTWNPVRGCQHGCRWTMPDGTVAECYAETIAERVAQRAYAQGFEHHYWNPNVLDEPLKQKVPSRIFLDSMSDLMGHWVPKEQVEQVLDICRQAHWHTFQLLTKNAPRLKEFDFPPNVWVGVSAPPSIMFGRPLSLDQQTRMLETMLKVLRDIRVPIRWMSIEPLSFDIAPLLVDSNLQWAVIGAATNGAKAYRMGSKCVKCA
jgi:protein gp37